jgi:hypothetical protein
MTGIELIAGGLAAGGAGGAGGLSSIATVLGVTGSLVSGFAAFQQSQYQAAIATANAKQAEVNAQLANEAAQQQAEDQGRQNAGLFGQQVAAQAASGLDINSPSSINSRLRTQELSYDEQLRIIDAGNAQQANYLTQSNQFKSEASASKTAAGMSILSTPLNAFGSYVGGADPTRFGSSPTSFVPKPQPRNRLYTPRN